MSYPRFTLLCLAFAINAEASWLTRLGHYMQGSHPGSAAKVGHGAGAVKVGEHLAPAIPSRDEIRRMIESDFQAHVEALRMQADDLTASGKLAEARAVREKAASLALDLNNVNSSMSKERKLAYAAYYAEEALKVGLDQATLEIEVMKILRGKTATSIEALRADKAKALAKAAENADNRRYFTRFSQPAYVRFAEGADPEKVFIVRTVTEAPAGGKIQVQGKSIAVDDALGYPQYLVKLKDGSYMTVDAAAFSKRSSVPGNSQVSGAYYRGENARLPSAPLVGNWVMMRGADGKLIHAKIETRNASSGEYIVKTEDGRSMRVTEEHFSAE